jgi:hypothetical protein
MGEGWVGVTPYDPPAEAGAKLANTERFTGSQFVNCMFSAK